MTGTATNFVELTFRADLDTLLGRWLRAVTHSELQVGYEATMAAALYNKARCWLLDVRRRGPIPEESTHWVIEAFLPRLVVALGGRVYMAFLVSPAHLNSLEQEQQLISHRSDAYCEVQLFTEEGPATQWLAGHCQPGCAVQPSA
ncbi:hypothetical protein [Hymenobacter sp. BT491]|uniref:hypothetical protein n=1 Tax=Hymenobacter sp. BT491 TaxID=2766779 RepID=UPI001653C3D6|nr:hypothetical protein [Hymenobacter sp. BT491]MBC6991351.1 hypothetical protein [Hymenobacter sp. BT491]